MGWTRSAHANYVYPYRLPDYARPGLEFYKLMSDGMAASNA